ncbi:MAG: murein hydrolase activator EnvC family protein [Gaiellaceae bacterium]
MGRAPLVVAASAVALLCAAPASALTDGARHPAVRHRVSHVKRVHRARAARRLQSVRHTMAFAWPAQGIVTTGFGHTEGRWHPGIDIGVLRSLTVKAAFPGVVKSVGYAAGFEGYGNIVLIQVRPDVVTLYAHLSSERVHPGQHVREGQTLGVAGCTGYCTGTHLHFEVRRNGVAVNPLQFLG